VTHSHPTSFSAVIITGMTIIMTHFHRGYTDVLSLKIELNLVTYVQSHAHTYMRTVKFVSVETLKNILLKHMRCPVSFCTLSNFSQTHS
jgi:hypothetical protein